MASQNIDPTAGTNKGTADNGNSSKNNHSVSKRLGILIKRMSDNGFPLKRNPGNGMHGHACSIHRGWVGEGVGQLSGDRGRLGGVGIDVQRLVARGTVPKLALKWD